MKTKLNAIQTVSNKTIYFIVSSRKSNLYTSTTSDPVYKKNLNKKEFVFGQNISPRTSTFVDPNFSYI